MQGHETWISFDNVNVWKLTQLLFLRLSKEAVTAAEFGTFTAQYSDPKIFEWGV